MSKKIKYGIFIIIVILPLTIIGGYKYAESSEPYRIAGMYITEHETIREHIGKIKNQELGLFGYSIKYVGPVGTAEFNVAVSGERKNGNIYISMRKETGVWKIIKGNLIIESMPPIVLNVGK